MSSTQRLAVWNGERERTTGGLRRSDLVKNRHGRLVSKKKSAIARKLNNLGKYLAGTRKTKSSPKKVKKAPEKADEKKEEKKPERHKKKPTKRRQKLDLVTKMTQDPEVKAKRKKILKRKTQVSSEVDVANIIPEIPKEEKRVTRRTGRRRKKVDYSKMGGTLITQKQLEKARKKPVPRRRRKKPKNADPVLDTIHV